MYKCRKVQCWTILYLKPLQKHRIYLDNILKDFKGNVHNRKTPKFEKN